MLNLYIRILAYILTVSGAIGVSSKAKNLILSGFGLWIISNSIWLLNALTIRDYVQVLLWATMIIIATRGVLNNSKWKN